MNPDDFLRRKHRNRARVFIDAETPAAQRFENWLRARAKRLDRGLAPKPRTRDTRDIDAAIRQLLARRP